MRHGKRGRHLNRNASHRRSLFRNLSRALITHERIVTTVAKAKELRPFIEKLITLAKKAALVMDTETDAKKAAVRALHYRRLAMAEEEADVSDRCHGEFIVPSKAVNELTRLLQETGQSELQIGENQAAFKLSDEKGGGITIITKLIEGNYPNYRQVIPGDPKERIALGRDDLLHVLRRAEIMTSEKQNSVKLAFTKNNLAITANSPDIGEAQESMAINYKGRDVSIAFNPGYLLDPLNALDNDEVFLELIDELSPGVLKINGPYLYVVMPMRLT